MIRASDLLPPGAPRLGFGCGDLFGGADEAQSIRLVEAALDAGVRWFDVARLYGNGSAEGVVGKALGPCRDRVVLVGKAGITPWSMRHGARLASAAARLARRAGPLARRLVPEPEPARERYGAFAAAELRRSVEMSLKALRTEYLDVLLLHECGLSHALAPETLRLLELLRAQGKVRRFGIATGAAETIEILRQAPDAAEVAQLASDAFDRRVAALPRTWRGLVVAHGALRRALPRLQARLARDAGLAAWFAARTGAQASDRPGLARLLLMDAAAANAAGVVLVSTTRPQRIAEAVQAASRIDAAALEALGEVLGASDLQILPRSGEGWAPVAEGDWEDGVTAAARGMSDGLPSMSRAAE
jgi:aryl-alcohol dehydrogenase-like predicted oxidoreductase